MSTDLATHVRPDGEIVTEPCKPDSGIVAKTPAECRVDEVSQGLTPAYQKASTLELTDEEAKALMEPFPDAFVEIRSHDGLIFLPHIHIRRRLCQVFRPGAWSLIQRRAWKDGNTVYGEYVMVIRGCFVGESIGGHQYVANNPKINYSDAIESTAAEALRRIAAKALSCGDQCWDPSYSREWVANHAYKGTDGKWHRKNDSFGEKRKTTTKKQQTPPPVDSDYEDESREDALPRQEQPPNEDPAVKEAEGARQWVRDRLKEDPALADINDRIISDIKGMREIPRKAAWNELKRTMEANNYVLVENKWVHRAEAEAPDPSF